MSGTWRTQRIEHLFLEPESALAEPLPDGRLRAATARGRASSTTAGRWRASSACAEEQVHVELVPNGGAFGGKEDMSVQAQTALLARVDRPAGASWRSSREESIRLHPKRHPIRLRLHGRLRRRGAAHRGRGAHARRHRAPTPRSAARCSSAPPATPAAPTACPTWTSRRSRSTPTTRRAGRCAASARTRRTSRSRAASTCSPSKRGSTAGRSAAATPSTSATSFTTGQVLEKSVGIKTDARRGQGRLLRGARRAGRRSGSPAASRTAASATASRSGAGPAGGRDATAPSRSTTATPRWARGC